MRRPSFSVVTVVVAILVAFGILAHFLKGAIGKVPGNSLATAPEVFLSQAGEQQIDWQRLDESAFNRARHMNRPILLVAGSGDSDLARYFDLQVLTNLDVMSRLRRAFICVRVDTDAAPQWMNAFHPSSRAAMDFLEDLGVSVIDPEGRLVATYLPTRPNSTIDYKSFLSYLNDAERNAARGINGAQAQQQEVQTLETSIGPGLPAFGTQLGQLVQFDNPNGGFPIGTRQNLLPLAWRFLLIQGRIDAFKSSIDPVLLSPIVNWIDGGFFRTASSVDWSNVSFDESAELDAEMMWTLAMADAAIGNPFYRALAERTFDRLLGNFGGDTWIPAYQKGDELLTLRSVRYSFPPRTVRELFPASEDRDWVQENLQLRASGNPLMVPQLKDQSIWASQLGRLNQSLDILRKASTDARVYGGQGILEVNGLVAARLQQCARLWHDRDRLMKAIDLGLHLDDFEDGDDVSRQSSAGVRVSGCLPDYLGYADACLQTFLATGRLDRFRQGLRVLHRAVFLFGSGHPGAYHLASSPPPLPLSANPPEILDHYRESSSAWLARLALAYGQLQGGKGRDLVTVADQIIAKFAATASDLGPYACGYYEAAARVSRSEAAFCVGPKADELASALYQRSPSRLIAIAGGDVRGDLDSRKPGIYLVRGDEVRGPFTVEEASRQLPFAFPFDAP